MNCLDNKDIEIFGDSFTDEEYYLEIKFLPCSSECAADVDTFLIGKSLQISYMISHVNMTDFSEVPIHHVIDTNLKIPFRKQAESRADIMVQRLSFDREE